MALQEGIDYVFCLKTTYIGSLGVGDGCLVGTRSLLLMVPLKVEAVVWNSHVTTTTFQLGNEPVNAGIARVLSQAALTVEELEAFMRQTVGRLEGAALTELHTQRRVRVRSGWFSRGIYCSEKEKGPGWMGYPLKGKELAQRWVAFYQQLPNFVS